MASYLTPSSTSTLCIFCCYSFYPPKRVEGVKRTKQSVVFNNFVNELDLSLAPGYSLGDAVCQDCFKGVEAIINSKRRASVVEDKVRRLSNEMLMAVQDLDKCLERFEKDLRGMNGTVEGSDLACLQSYVEDGTYSGDVFLVREKIKDVVRDMGAFKKDFYGKIYNELKKLDVSKALNLKPGQRSTFQQAANQVILSTAQAPATGLPSSRVNVKGPGLRQPISPVKLKPGQGIRQGPTVIRVISTTSSNGNPPPPPPPTSSRASLIKGPGGPGPGPRSRPGPASSKLKSGDEYKCRQCRLGFPTMDSMKDHEYSTHRLYQCSWCQKSFTNSGNVRAHERLHTGERPYKCADCPKSFKQMGGLSYHLRANPSHSALRVGQARARQNTAVSGPGSKKKRAGAPVENGIGACSVGDSMAEVVHIGGVDNGQGGGEEWEDVIMKMDPDDVEVEVDGLHNYLEENGGVADGDYFMEDYGTAQEGGRGEGDDPLGDIQWM